MNFASPEDHRVNLKEYEERDKYLDLARELKKLWNIKVAIISIIIDLLGTVTKGLVTRTGQLGNIATSVDCPNKSIVENNQNTRKSPKNLRRLAVTQTSKISQL